MKKVRSGDPLHIPAATFNTFIDAARDFQQRQRNAGQFPQAISTSAETILVKNNSGGDLQRFSVLGIDGILFDPSVDLDRFKNSPVLIGVTPLQTDHTGKFVILAEPLKADTIGRAWIQGTCPAYINVASESDGFADVKDGDAASLQSGPDGLARIVWKESGTGLKWAVVVFGAGQPATRVYRAVSADEEVDGQYNCYLQKWSNGQWSDANSVNVKCKVSIESGYHNLTDALLVAVGLPDEYGVLPATPLFYSFAFGD